MGKSGNRYTKAEEGNNDPHGSKDINTTEYGEADT